MKHRPSWEPPALLFTAVVVGFSLYGAPADSVNLLVSGHVTQWGKPAHPREISLMIVGKIRVRLYPGKDGKFDPAVVYSAGVDPEDGSFTIRNVPPGQYKVCVTWNNNPAVNDDALHGRFSFENSKITFEATEGEELEIEVGS